MCNQCNSQKNSFLEGVILGAVAGAAACIFLGSDEGKKMQKVLKKKASPYIDDVVDVLDELKDQSTELLDKAEEVKDALQEKLEDNKEKVGSAISEKLEGSLSHIEELQERGREATSSIRKRFFRNIKK